MSNYNCRVKIKETGEIVDAVFWDSPHTNGKFEVVYKDNGIEATVCYNPNEVEELSIKSDIIRNELEN